MSHMNGYRLSALEPCNSVPQAHLPKAEVFFVCFVVSPENKSTTNICDTNVCFAQIFQNNHELQKAHGQGAPLSVEHRSFIFF